MYSIIFLKYLSRTCSSSPPPPVDGHTLFGGWGWFLYYEGGDWGCDRPLYRLWFNNPSQRVKTKQKKRQQQQQQERKKSNGKKILFCGGVLSLLYTGSGSRNKDSDVLTCMTMVG